MIEGGYGWENAGIPMARDSVILLLICVFSLSVLLLLAYVMDRYVYCPQRLPGICGCPSPLYGKIPAGWVG
jgi:hypothetical protein